MTEICLHYTDTLLPWSVKLHVKSKAAFPGLLLMVPTLQGQTWSATQIHTRKGQNWVLPFHFPRPQLSCISEPVATPVETQKKVFLLKKHMAKFKTE